MAVDTREKRASAVNGMLPYRGLLPLADGTIGQGDRQQVGGVYSGILATEAEEVPPAPAIILGVMARRRGRRE